MGISYEHLIEKARMVRLTALKTALTAGKGHVPPAFSWADIGVVLYYAPILQLRHEEPDWEDRDRLILSKGHACLTLYAILSDLGYFDLDELDLFASDGAMLPGHPDPCIPGVDAISGSLGHGLGVATGMALTARLDGKSWRTFTILGDGECQEGSVWEAAMFAGHHHLSNIVAIVDRNGLSATNFTEEIVSLDPLAGRFESFGWETATIDGHNFEEILKAFSTERASRLNKPLAVIANTVKGKGVDFMENSPNWHHQLPKGKSIDDALEQLTQSNRN